MEYIRNFWHLSYDRFINLQRDDVIGTKSQGAWPWSSRTIAHARITPFRTEYQTDFSEHFKDNKHSELLIDCIDEYKRISMINGCKEGILLVNDSHSNDKWYVTKNIRRGRVNFAAEELNILIHKNKYNKQTNNIHEYLVKVYVPT